MEQNETNPAWAREAVFVRLTKRRKAKLLAIAKDMDAAATPSDAIERAIDLASSGGQSSSDLILDRLSALLEIVDQMSIEQRNDAKRSEAAISAAMRSSQAVLDLLNTVAESGDDEG